ncbi:exodeoxyribonuclease V subunit gamma [Acinetobacter sp. WZC-1]|uniref:exodeoxyribonuclease V subunit gamma n=1 Tax=Acinetobacter sp. WZC-1 TaxID=3459034 RepID=UPI00403E208F
MGIHVIQSQRIDVLVQGVLQSSPQPSAHPFAVLQAQHFIVPTPAVQEWLTRELAEQRGISANTQFHQRIRGFQWYAYQQVLENKDQVRKANVPRLMMKWRIYHTLQAFIATDEIALDTAHPLYAIILRIYDSAARLENGPEKQLKKQGMLYWLSEQVSRLFSHYMLYRGANLSVHDSDGSGSNWLQAWGQDQALDLERLFYQSGAETSAFRFSQIVELEQWQRWLWQHTFHEDFSQMQRIDSDFWQIMDDTEQREAALKKLPSQLMVFTLLDLPPAQLHFLRRLGQYLDVFILHYNPSQEYWADSVDPHWKKQYDLRVKERFIQKNPHATDAEIARFFDEFTLNFNAEIRESRHPLLTRFGKQARDHFSLLSSLSSGEEGQWVDAFVDEFPDGLLGRLQSDILYLAEPEPHGCLLKPQDDSIQIHVCHSTLRQLEVLREQLIHWLSQGTAAQLRRPGDILIQVPNLKQIEPLIRSVFPHLPDADGVFLPVKIAGVAQLDVQHAWRAVLGRIQLVQGRFSIEDFADWLNLHATQRYYRLEIQGTERILALLSQAGFKRGLDAEHLAQTLSKGDADYRFSLKFALDRLALGIAIPEHTLFEETLSYADVLPGDFELIAVLMRIYQDFSERRDWMILHEQGQRIRVEQWLKCLIQDISEFEQVGVESLKTVRDIIEKQRRMLTLASFYDEQQHAAFENIMLPLPYLLQEIQHALDSQMDQVLPTGQISFSEIGQLRPLPYQLIVMLNLDSGQFPDRSVQLPFDLMQLLKPQLGDRSRLEDDQGAFLDALLLARNHLWLFYNGFDVNDGEVREPSSVLQEFISHIALMVRLPSAVSSQQMISVDGIEVPEQIRQLYHVHPLQPFDPVGFEAAEALRYQDQWFAVAQQIHALQMHQANAPFSTAGWVNTDYPQPQQSLIVVDAGQWIQDVTFPARLYLSTLGVENLKAEDVPEQDEPLMLDGLRRYVIRDFLQQQDAGSAADADDRAALLQDQLPVGKVQHSAWQIGVAEQENLRQRLAKYAAATTPTTQRQWRIQPEMVMNISVPVQAGSDWVSVEASSARAKRRARVWLEYLLWLSFTRLEDTEASRLKRIALFSDVTIISTGLTAGQARNYLQQWLQAYAYAQTQPLVLPAALLLQPAEKGKQLEWGTDEAGHVTLLSFADLLKEWYADSARFLTTFSVEDNEATSQHRDWQFILQEQDATALLKQACDQFAYALYQPVYQYQSVAEE